MSNQNFDPDITETKTHVEVKYICKNEDQLTLAMAKFLTFQKEFPQEGYGTSAIIEPLHGGWKMTFRRSRSAS